MSNLVDQSVTAVSGQAAAIEAAAAPVSPIVTPVGTVAVPTASPTKKPKRKNRSDAEVASWRSAVDEWNTLLDDARRAGGLLPSIRGFCRERELREPSCYWWRREFAVRDGKPLPTMRSADSTRATGHRPAKRPETLATFVQLRVKPSVQAVAAVPGSLCELVVGSVVVRVSPGFDAPELARLLDVLATAR